MNSHFNLSRPRCSRELRIGSSALNRGYADIIVECLNDPGTSLSILPWPLAPEAAYIGAALKNADLDATCPSCALTADLNATLTSCNINHWDKCVVDPPGVARYHWLILNPD